MEHFEQDKGRVREKSVYLLHLDTPRIIIISSVVIGVIVVSFLLGMNFIKKGDAEAVTADNMMVQEKSDFFQTNNIPAPPSDDDSLFSAEKNPVNEKIPAKETNTILAETESKVKPDVFNSENINEIITPAVKETKPAKKINVVSVEPSEKKAVKKTVKRKKQVSRVAIRPVKKKHVKKQQRVVPVVAEKKKHIKNGPHYAVQVASYDKHSTAMNEIDRLKKEKYSAYISNTMVGSTRFYRVRIGPVSSKKNALSLLKEVNKDSRYKDSYMIKE